MNRREDTSTYSATLLVGALALVNAALWLAAAGVASLRHFPLLLSTGLLAYSFGLRHAVDADHIAAIDNVTRKLIQEGRRPLTVGLFFSLGHSTIVVVLCAALALATGYVQRHLPGWHETGGLIGTLVSGVFLFVIGLINLIVLADLVRQFRRALRKEGNSIGEDAADSAPPPGLIGRLLRPLLSLIRHPAQMYLVGLLFGLGFDTATEVGILALSARSGQAGLPFLAVMLLPLLFTAGMCLVDTLDGILMVGAYGWAQRNPARKLYYNLTVTLLSVLVAFVVGAWELLGILQERLSLQGAFWNALGRLPFNDLGFWIVGVFAAGWLLSMLLYRWRWRHVLETPTGAA